LKKL
jgi:hypothetical protein